MIPVVANLSNETVFCCSWYGVGVGFLFDLGVVLARLGRKVLPSEICRVCCNLNLVPRPSVLPVPWSERERQRQRDEKKRGPGNEVAVT